MNGNFQQFLQSLNLPRISFYLFINHSSLLREFASLVHFSNWLNVLSVDISLANAIEWMCCPGWQWG